MGDGQCWFVYANGSRCAESALREAFFCSRHRDVRMHEVSRIWRAPEAEMPRELVAAMRLSNPGVTFPAPGPPGDKGLAEPASETQPCVPFPGPEPGPSTRLASVPSAPSSPEGEVPGSPLGWLLATLQAAMEGVMAGDATPLQKANAVARLSGQYLKAYGVKELEREKKDLDRRLSAAEARVAELETRLAAQASELLVREEAVSPYGSPAEQTDPEASPRFMGTPDDLWLTLGVEEPLTRRVASSIVSSTAGAVAEDGDDPP